MDSKKEVFVSFRRGKDKVLWLASLLVAHQMILFIFTHFQENSKKDS